MPRAIEAQWSMKAFSKMTKLRLLKIYNVDVSEGPKYLSNELRFLEWHAYPSKSLPACFQPDELVEVYMSFSNIEQLWYGRKELCLDGIAIAELPSSFHRLAGLILLSMSRCKNLESIPSSISGLKSLKKLDVSDCSELKNIPENLGKVESLEEFDASGTSIRQPPTSFFLLKNLKVLSFNGCKRVAVNLTDQVLPSLSGLCSLEKLDLRACNLGEGAIPEDIGFLSSLRSLNLSRNNFVSLSRSINQLSRLEKLALKDCVMLESLPEVPLKVQKVKLDGCLRLKEILDPIKLNSMERSEFKCLNCWELYKHNGQNNMGLSMLEKYLQGSLPRPGFGIIVPGNDVPDWFNHQSKESSIKVQIPRNEWMGFAACVAFNAYGKSPLFCQFKVDGKESYPSPMYIGCNSMQAVSDHLWLFYLSFDYLKDIKDQKNEAFSNLELSFNSYEQGVKVKNCGAHLVNSSYTPLWQSPIGHLIVACKEAASSYIDSLANSLSYNQWMHDVFCSLKGVHSSNNFTHLYTTLIQKESYTIVFDKDEEDFSENKEKVQRWMNILAEVTIPSSESSKRVNDMDWPVGNKFYGADLECVQNFLKQIQGERNECDIDFEFDVTPLVKS
ncbi:hypothetical protein SADUNF_Sadunf13G0077400 [Salix dunnii]|uniref:C-JID domain-containing protein n=1 Tax=Salix dunnii TaxID=1413687 RepID=A0A835JKZ7_9ROSI|nr:hypothetical protein SADUNF_Sadunf13G0077400 [Salix dunnii]